jgi:two-component system chemotaxis sensor kinase CheA
LDLEKYRTLFVQEASDHLVEMGRALLALEGGASGAAADEAVDTLFRMAHSIKGMAASLEYDSAAALAHALEDCLEPLRRGGGMDAVVLQLATEAIRALEEMVATVDATGAAPLPRAQLVEWLRDPASARAQPLGIAHPPRPAPSRSVRVRTELIDRFLASIGELLQRRERLEELHRYAPAWEGRHELAEELDGMEHLVRELRRRALDIRTTSVQRLTERLPMVASDLARALDKRVRFEVSGDEVEVDRAILDHLDDSLLHLVRNAVDHGIEPPAQREAAGKDPVGTLRIRAWLEAGRLRLTLSDDGRGIDVETLRRKAVERGLLMEMVAEDLPPERVFEFVFEPGMSTAEKVTDISGRGVGMDAVKRAVEALGGTIALHSAPGTGTEIELDLPSMVALQRVLLAQVGGERVALPLAPLEAVLGAEEARVEREDGVDAFFLYKDEPLPLLDLGQHIGLPRVDSAHAGNVLVLEVRGFKLGLHVERAVRNLEVYVRDVPPPLDEIPVLGGVAILPDGAPVFLLELGVVVERFL